MSALPSEFVRQCHNLGLNLFPVDREKKPPILGYDAGGKELRYAWGRWKNGQQTISDVEAMPWDKATGVAGISGPGGWRCFDFDDVSDPWLIATCLNVLHLSGTYKWVVKTPGKVKADGSRNPGYHIWVYSPNLKLDKGKLQQDAVFGADHVELRAFDHYTVLPGSIHPDGGTYQFVNGDPTNAPATVDADRLLMAFKTVTIPTPQPSQPQRQSTSNVNYGGNGAGHNPAYVTKAIQNEIQLLEGTSSGRNNQLNQSAYSLAGYLHTGVITEAELSDLLYQAAVTNGYVAKDGEAEARKTIQSGIDQGKLKRKDVPDPQVAPGIPIGMINNNGTTPPISQSTGGATGTQQAQGATTQQPRTGKQKQADSLYELARRNALVFRSQDSEAYGYVMVNNHRECYKLRSSDFRSFLAHLFWQVTGAVPGAQAVEDALRALEFDARQTYQEVFVRVGCVGDTSYIDLGNEVWNAIEVNASGWRVVDMPPIAFRRTKGMAALPTPVQGGSIEDLRRFLTASGPEFYLVVVWLLAVMLGKGPFTILTMIGEQGAAKSTNLKVLKRLIDPSKPLLRSQPKETRDLMIAATRNYLLAFDNISHIAAEISDAMCQISTGGGFATRSNYTDDEEALFDVMRPLAMNGITDIVQRSDLMDRAIVIQLPAIPESERREENVFWAEFDADHPILLGAALDTLTQSLAILPTVKFDSLPRMADFAKLGAAAGQAMGLGNGEFMRLYRDNRKDGAAAILDNSPLLEPLEKLMAAALTRIWEGKPTDLLSALNNHATDLQKSSREWPKSPNALSATLKRLAPNFRQRGIDLKNDKVNGVRKWVLRYI